MQRTGKRLAAVLPALGVLALVGIAATSPFPRESAAAEQAAAREWVAQNAGRLPTTYEGIAALPLTYRKAIMVSLTDSQREAVWRSHLESFVKPRQELTPAQLRVRDSLGITVSEAQWSFIWETLESLRTGIGEGTTSEAKQAYAARVCKKAKLLFPELAAFRVVAAIGVVPDRRKPVGMASLMGDVTAAIREATVTLGLRQHSLVDCAASV